MRLDNRISKFENWLCPAPVVPVHVYIVMPGCRVVGGKVYREAQFPAGSNAPFDEVQYTLPELRSECKDADGRVMQRCFVCAVPNT